MYLAQKSFLRSYICIFTTQTIFKPIFKNSQVDFKSSYYAIDYRNETFLEMIKTASKDKFQKW